MQLITGELKNHDGVSFNYPIPNAAMNPERRQFERLSLREEIIAFDQSERRLGRILDAGGGGMAIRLESDSDLRLACGEKFKVTVVQPGRELRHTIAVIVRHNGDGRLGLEFSNRNAG